jgi:hypothetical protein
MNSLHMIMLYIKKLNIKSHFPKVIHNQKKFLTFFNLIY